MSKIQRGCANVNGIRLFYLDSQTPGEAIICLHGRWGRAETWVDFIQHYAIPYRIIAPDLRGHGLSDKPLARYTAEEMAADVLALAQTLGIERFTIVGHSMGGHIAAWIAAHHPERVKACAILDKSPDGPAEADPRPPEDIPAIDPITRDWPLPFSSLTEARRFIRAQNESEYSYQYFMNSLQETVDGYRMVYSNQAIAANIAYYQSWYDLLPRIECPTLIARACSHEAVSDEAFAAMQAQIRQCMACEIPHPDHNIHLSDPQSFYQYFDTFLTEHPSPALP